MAFAQTTGDFRTNGAVTFASATNWQRYNGTAWVAAAAAPTSADGAILIRASHTASVTTNVTLDQVSVDGILQVNDGATLTLANGTGDDLFVRNRLFFQATGVISGAGQLVLGNQAIVQTANVGGLAGSITSTNPTLTAGASYWFNGTAAQSTGFAGFASLGNPLNLSFANTVGVTIDRNLAITGTLNSIDNAVITIGTGLTSFVADAIYNNGTFTVGTGVTTVTTNTIYNKGTFNNCANATITPAFTTTNWRTKGIYQSLDSSEPTTEASNIWTNSHKTTAHIYWMQSGSGNNRIVVLKAGSAVDVNAAIDNTTYSANTAFGTGTPIDGGFVVYNGAGSQVNVTGLTEGTTYHVAVFEYNQDCSGNRNYKTGSPLTTSFVATERPFITEWITTDGTLTIPTTTGLTYNYTVSYRQLPAGTPMVLTGQTGDCTLTGLTNNVTYEVSITGTFPRIHFGFSSYINQDKIRNIKQWGSIQWASMEQAFGASIGCEKLNSNATDVPNFSNVTSLQSMFSRCSIFNGGNITHWNTQNVTNMWDMFNYATAFNQPIGNWNTQNVTTMRLMFLNATAFNQPIGNWNTQSVTVMQEMFRNATSFNQPIGTWNTQNVINMRFMFSNATAFDQPIGAWNTQSVTNMSQMFLDAIAFKQPIGNWNTQSVISMTSMFCGAISFNQPIGTWNMQSVTNTSEMFLRAETFNQPIGMWNTQNVTSMSLMFQVAYAFNQPIGMWNTQNVTDMQQMFWLATSFNQPIGNWNTQSVTSMYYMFYRAYSFNQPVGTWNTQSVTDMYFMFNEATAFNQSLADWNITNVVHNPLLAPTYPRSMLNMLDNCGMNTANYDATLIGWAAQNVKTGLYLGARGRVYSCGAAATARQSLITGKGWEIREDLGDCISNSVSTLSAFSACSGVASVAQSYTVSGSNLTANIVITAPTHFEVSVTSATTGFAATQTLTQSSGSVGSTTVYIRQKSTAPNGASGTVTHTSTGMLTKNVSIPVSAVNALPTITGISTTSVNSLATTFNLSYTGVTNAPNQYSITTGTPTAMPSFVAVSNATLAASPLAISIPASAAATYNFRLTVTNSTTGCVSAVVPFTLVVTSATPTISTTGTPSAVTTVYGTASSSTNFNVSGANMTAGILVTPPNTNFEVSLDNTTFTNTVTVGAAGTIASTPVYIRLKATATVAGSPYSGNIVLSSTGATNVNVAMPNSTVTAKPLTITGLTGVSKVYDRTTTATTTGTPTLSGVVSGDVITLGGTIVRNFANFNVGTGKAITITGYTISGTASGNYSLTQPTGLTANITAKPLTITGLTGTNKTFDGNNTATLSGAATLNGVETVDVANVTLGGTVVANFASSAVGTGIAITVTGYTLSGTAAGNYTVSQPTGLTGNITAAGGTTIYVRLDGNDANDGFTNTISGAKLTLQGAFTAVGDGNTVVLNAGTYNETATLTGKSITFQGVGNPTVQTVVMNGAGKTLTLSGNVNISEMVNVQAGDLATGGNLTLLATATKQAMLIQSATTNVNGNVNVQRYLRANAGTSSLGYRFMSSSTSNATFAQLSELNPVVNADFNTSTNPGRVRPFPTLYTYDATRAGDPSKTFTASPSPDFDKGWTSPAALTENMGVGRGYTVNTSANQVAEITGTVNNGNVSVPIVTGNVASSGYNLVGNPYPSPISWTTVLAASTGVNNAIYQNMATGQYTGSWASYVGGVGTNGATDDIAVMQGFFVIANAGGSINFTNAARATSYKNPSSFRTEDDKNASKNQGLLRLAMTNTAGKTDETVVYFADKATQNFDSQYDAVKFQLNAGNFPNIYTTDNKTLFSINALPQLNDDLIIPITVQSWTEGVQKIAMTEKLNFTREVQVFLKDKSNGKLYDLSKGSFEFSMAAGVLADRFELIFKPQFTQSELNGDILSVYPNPTADKISISMGDDYKGTLTLRLTDVSGREIWVEKTEKSGKIYQTSTSLENLASGTYFLEVEGSKKVVKKIVKQ